MWTSTTASIKELYKKVIIFFFWNIRGHYSAMFSFEKQQRPWNTVSPRKHPTKKKKKKKLEKNRCLKLKQESVKDGLSLSPPLSICVCVCVWEWEG